MPSASARSSCAPGWSMRAVSPVDRAPPPVGEQAPRAVSRAAITARQGRFMAVLGGGWRSRRAQPQDRDPPAWWDAWLHGYKRPEAKSSSTGLTTFRRQPLRNAGDAAEYGRATSRGRNGHAE